MAEGYGIKVGDVALVAAVGAAFYFIYKTIKPATDAAQSLISPIQSVESSGADLAKNILGGANDLVTNFKNLFSGGTSSGSSSLDFGMNLPTSLMTATTAQVAAIDYSKMISIPGQGNNLPLPDKLSITTGGDQVTKKVQQTSNAINQQINAVANSSSGKVQLTPTITANAAAVAAGKVVLVKATGTEQTGSYAANVDAAIQQKAAAAGINTKGLSTTAIINKLNNAAGAKK